MNNIACSMPSPVARHFSYQCHGFCIALPYRVASTFRQQSMFADRVKKSASQFFRRKVGRVVHLDPRPRKLDIPRSPPLRIRSPLILVVAVPLSMRYARVIVSTAEFFKHCCHPLLCCSIVSYTSAYADRHLDARYDVYVYATLCKQTS